MSTQRKTDGKIPRQREHLPRIKRSVRFDLRPGIYEKLLRLGQEDALGRAESAVATIERLILAASERL